MCAIIYVGLFAIHWSYTVLPCFNLWARQGLHNRCGLSEKSGQWDASVDLIQGMPPGVRGRPLYGGMKG